MIPIRRRHWCHGQAAVGEVHDKMENRHGNWAKSFLRDFAKLKLHIVTEQFVQKRQMHKQNKNNLEFSISRFHLFSHNNWQVSIPAGIVHKGSWALVALNNMESKRNNLEAVTLNFYLAIASLLQAEVIFCVNRRQPLSAFL